MLALVLTTNISYKRAGMIRYCYSINYNSIRTNAKERLKPLRLQLWTEFECKMQHCVCLHQSELLRYCTQGKSESGWGLFPQQESRRCKGLMASENAGGLN